MSRPVRPSMPGTLYVVATPIGNLEDTTYRAVRVLREVALIAAEDTRRTGTLLRHYGIETPIVSFHEHNAHARLPGLITRLQAGDDVALVSDAGTPAVSDPGTELVAGCHTAGVRVVPIPGPSSVLAAASASGFPLVPFTFLGFAPHRAKDRDVWLQSVAAIPHTVVFFEAPHRINSLLQRLADVLVGRQIVVGRELTKVHEELLNISISGTSGSIWTGRGEYTLVVGPAAVTATPGTDIEVLNEFGRLTESGGVLKTRAAAAAVVRKHGRSTQDVYDLVLRHRRQADEP